MLPLFPNSFRLSWRALLIAAVLAALVFAFAGLPGLLGIGLVVFVVLVIRGAFAATGGWTLGPPRD